MEDSTIQHLHATLLSIVDNLSEFTKQLSAMHSTMEVLCSSLKSHTEALASSLKSAPLATKEKISSPGTIEGSTSAGNMKSKKRGRPPRGKIAKVPPTKKQRQNKEEEDVCFICLDGGSLVLCDHEDCPKAYHPACIHRDEAFFRSNAEWYCGQHICIVCQQTSHYMCYTCTYALCNGCIKTAAYFSIRGNKGLCKLCMETIEMIEKKDQGANKEVVDFDSEMNWEYLFKVYWIQLKKKVSLTLSELTQAKTPLGESNKIQVEEAETEVPCQLHQSCVGQSSRQNLGSTSSGSSFNLDVGFASGTNSTDPLDLTTWDPEVMNFTNLPEQTLSDLFDEIDAMESQNENGIGLPTSVRSSDEQMIQDYESFILDLYEDLSPTSDPATSDGLSFREF